MKIFFSKNRSEANRQANKYSTGIHWDGYKDGTHQSMGMIVTLYLKKNSKKLWCRMISN